MEVFVKFNTIHYALKYILDISEVYGPVVAHQSPKRRKKAFAAASLAGLPRDALTDID